jgi:hypothetical protein
VAWPAARKRPPGDDFFQFCAGLADGSLARAFTEHDDRGLADLLYRFALATCVGAHYDVAAARQNPGMSASGVLGLGQLSWAWFIFEALGAGEDAAISGRLLDNEWVRAQERRNQTLRQRAYYDLGAFLRTGVRGPALGRVFPLLPLTERAGWHEASQLEAALATHSEITGDQLTHHPLYYLWPASLYALARRARPLELRSVDLNHEVVLRLKEQLLRFGLLDEGRMAPLLDPLPVIVDVKITEVDDQTARGVTMLAAREEAEHHISAPRAGRDMHPGEVWLFEVQGAKASQAQASFADLGEVSYNIAVPTGQWLERA